MNMIEACLRIVLAVVIAFQFVGCATYLAAHPIALNNSPGDRAEWLRRNPEAADQLDQDAVPQDNRFHFSANAERLRDKQGNPNGFSVSLSAKCAWPRTEILRPQFPRRTQPPDGASVDSKAAAWTPNLIIPRRS